MVVLFLRELNSQFVIKTSSDIIVDVNHGNETVKLYNKLKDKYKYRYNT